MNREDAKHAKTSQASHMTVGERLIPTRHALLSRSQAVRRHEILDGLPMMGEWFGEIRTAGLPPPRPMDLLLGGGPVGADGVDPGPE